MSAAPPPTNHLPPPGLPPPMPPGGGGMPFTNTVLITQAPNFLQSFRAVREWLYPCGSTRTAVFYPRAKTGGNEEEAASPPKKISILVTFGHPDAAVKCLASFKEFSSRLDERYNQIDAFMVPNSPEIPLPPPVADEETTTVLGEKLWQNFVGIEAASAEEEDPASSSRTNIAAKENKGGGDSGGADEKKLDAIKVAAAAGGAYDAEDDPLNAPHVLEAVKAFRRNLETTQTFQQKRRIELVQQKLKDMRPRVEAQMVEERNRRKQQEGRSGPPPPLPLPPPGTSLPPPPLPSGLPPPPPGGAAAALPVPPTAAAADSGKRGRSNLPAWMTQQQQANDGPASKKTKRSYPINFPPNLAPSTHATLREFLTNQVKESLGEEEKTLIDFLYNHILQGKATSELLSELKVVLEEESDGFLEAVWAKVDELSKV